MDELLNQLHAYGLIIDGSPRLDGVIVRCKTEDNPNKKSGWYIGFTKYLNGKDYITCVYGDWSRDTEGHTYKSWQDDSKLSHDDIQKIRKAQQEAQKKIQLSQKRTQDKAAKDATHTWLKLSETGASPYLEKKQVKGFGVRYGKDPRGAFFVVPLVDEKGQITSLQRIYDDGQKRFLSGGRIKASCHIIGDISPLMPLCFAEGYATAASIHQATGLPVVVCFNAGNLEPVIARFRADEHIKADRFIICADNDKWKPDKGNPGMDKANDAAATHGCYIAAPVFDGLDTRDKPTDFNDLHLLAGIDAVKQAIMTDLNDDYAQQASTPQIITVSKDDPETPLIEDEIGYPTEKQRPCYRVYEGFLQVDKNKKLKPGVYYHYIKEGKENALPQVIDVWICSPLYVEAVTLDQYGNNYGRFLRFKTELGQWRNWAMPMAMLKGSGEELRGELLSMGVTLDVRSKLALLQYIIAQHPKETLEIANHIGWYKDAFILPDRCIGSKAYFFQSEHFNISDIPYRESGTLEDWKQNIARYCVGNPLLMLAACSAFAGALLEPAHQQGGGFHVFGDSSQGKSTVLFVAC